jgi:hypothetical protein
MLTVIQITGVFQAIGRCIMAVVNAIGSIIMAIGMFMISFLNMNLINNL